MRPSIKESAASLNFAAADLTTKYSAITFEFTTSRRARSSRSPAKVDSGINVIQSELRTRSSSRLNAVTFIIWLIETRPDERNWANGWRAASPPQGTANLSGGVDVRSTRPRGTATFRIDDTSPIGSAPIVITTSPDSGGPVSMNEIGKRE